MSCMCTIIGLNALRSMNLKNMSLYNINAHCLSFFKSTVIAHAGDGNFHVVILFDPAKEEQRREAERLNHLMVHMALSMEGTSCIFLGLSDSLFSSTRNNPSRSMFRMEKG